MRRTVLVLIAALVVSPISARGHGFGRWQRTTQSSYYFLPTPGMMVTAEPPMSIVGVPPLCPPMYATPIPAPPSVMAPPPASTAPPQRAPGVRESHSSYNAAASFLPPAMDGSALVGFWNLSGRDVVVQIGGGPHIVPLGQSLKLVLNRQFVWQVEGQAPQTEQLPDGVPGMEIVIRR